MGGMEKRMDNFKFNAREGPTCAGIGSLHAVELYFAAGLIIGSNDVGVLGALNLVELVHLPPSHVCYS
jgi:hypothetical protein